MEGFESSMRSFITVVHKESDLGVALCPEMGTTSQRHDIDEAVKHLLGATGLYREELSGLKVGRPLLMTFFA